MIILNTKVALIIPTLNAEKDNWHSILKAINSQTLIPDYKIILDSGSQDNTISIAQNHGFTIYTVEKGTFDHAGTRKWGIDLIVDKAEIVIFMTQDALLDDSISFQKLIDSFEDEQVGVAYGRQLPRKNASHIETFGRLYNYPKISETRTLSDKKKLGMKVAFCSDSFAAYRINLIKKHNSFPDRSIVGEDYITASRLLLLGYKIRYESIATVRHSHDYSVKEEFKRYFDIGVFHDEYSELLEQLGTTEKTGASYVKSELKYLLMHKPTHIPLSVIRTISKYLGYKIGKQHININRNAKLRLSMHKYYFYG